MKIKTDRQSELPRFVLGALATAGASVANAATVQITFANNYVSTSSGDTNFNGDLTGDGVADVRGRIGATYGAVATTSGAPIGSGFYSFGGSVAVIEGLAPTSLGFLSGLSLISFSDARINGGAITNGMLDLTVTSGSNNYKVQVNRLIFDDTSVNVPSGLAVTDGAYPTWNAVSAVPEASSSLALLALGAGGLLTRRRTKRAA